MKTNLKLQFIRKPKKNVLESKSNHPPGLISTSARKGTETHKTISTSTTNTIKTLPMLRARLHLLSHKKRLVLSGKQKEINFLIFIGRCGHGAKSALGACVEPAWSQTAESSSLSPALLQREGGTSYSQDRQSQLQDGPSCGTSSPEPQQTPRLYKMLGFNLRPH